MRCDRCDAPLDPECARRFVSGLPDRRSDADRRSAGRNGAFNYDLLEEIGRGGMGVVYRAVQRGSQRQVAVKMILSEQPRRAVMMERFRSEVKASQASIIRTSCRSTKRARSMACRSTA